MNNRNFLLIGMIIIGLAFSIYAWLGGFRNPEITQITTPEIFVVGKEFHGSIKSQELGKLFEEAGKLKEENTVPGELGNIMYNNPEKEGDTIRAFVGIIVPSANVKLPSGYELRSIPAGKKALRAQINAHYMLAPGKLYPAAFQYAKENKLQTQDIFIERFPDTHKADFIILLK